MTSHRLFPSTNGAATSSSDAGLYVFGLSFKVTATNQQLDGWWWWVADVAQDVHARNFALRQVTGAAAGTLVSGSVTLSAALSLGWNFIAASPAIPLTMGQEYRAVTGTPILGGSNNYAAVANFWSTGAGGAGITSGPLFAYAGSGGSGTVEPADAGQMTFNASPHNPPDLTLDYPSTSFNATWYGMDVQVSDIGSGPVNTGAFFQFFA